MKLQDKVLFNGKGANLLKPLISLNILWWYCLASLSAWWSSSLPPAVCWGCSGSCWSCPASSVQELLGRGGSVHLLYPAKLWFTVTCACCMSLSLRATCLGLVSHWLSCVAWGCRCRSLCPAWWWWLHTSSWGLLWRESHITYREASLSLLVEVGPWWEKHYKVWTFTSA